MNDIADKKLREGLASILESSIELRKELVEAYNSSPYDMLHEFHQKFGAAINQPMTKELCDLRETLILEEAKEVVGELTPSEYMSNLDQRKRLTKELADLMYVTIGTAVTFGLPLKEVFEEVHKSNMSKLGDDGKPIYREDGKVLKGPNYKEPDLDQFF